MPAADTPDFNTATLRLYRISGVAGLLMQKGANQLAMHLPFTDIRALELGELLQRMCEGYAAQGRSVCTVLIVFEAGALLTVIRDEVYLAFLLTSRADLDAVASTATDFLEDHAEITDALSAEKQVQQMHDPLKPREMVVTGSLAASDGVLNKPEPLPQIDRAPEAEAAPPPVEPTPEPPPPAAEPEISCWPAVRKILDKVLGKVMGRAQVNNLITRVCAEEKVDDPFKLSLRDATDLARSVLNQVPNRTKRASLLSELEHAFQEANL